MEPCKEEIYRDGTVVAILNGGSSHIEEVVQETAKCCGFTIDWHYTTGRAYVKTLGDVTVARDKLFGILEARGHCVNVLQ